MKKLVTVGVFAIAFFVTYAQDNAEWFRYPAISPDGKTIAFVYKGDIYTVPAEGGTAKALTTHPAHDYMPVWSKRGDYIAFASNRYGNMDVFVIPATGGEPLRLTYHSADELPYSFTFDDKSVLFGAVRHDPASSRLYPTTSQPELYSVPVTGGWVAQVLPVPAEAVATSADGKFLVYHDKKGGENEWRKHHQSAIARDIWLYNTSTKTYTQLTRFTGEDRNPVFAPDGSTIYFLREDGGSFNVFSMPLSNPASVTQVTNFTTHPVRFLSISQNGTLCFGYDGSIYTLNGNSKPKKISIAIRNDSPVNPEQLVGLNSSIREVAVSPDGKEVAFIARGEVFVTSVEGAFTKRITNTPVQERFVSFLPDGKSLIYASERNGKWEIIKATRVRAEEPFFFASTLISEEVLVRNEHDNYQPLPSPDGKKLAYIEDRTTLKVLDLEKKSTQTLLTSAELYYMSDGDQYFTWSPDSRWLLVEYNPTMGNQEVVAIPADNSSPFVNLTMNGYDDFRPRWANGGKQVIWLSTREGLRSYANSGERQADVYSLFMTREAWDKFRLSKDDFNLQKAIEEKLKEAKKKEEEKKQPDKTKKGKQQPKPDSTLKFDWEGLEFRMSRLTTTSADIADALLSSDGETLYYLARYDKGYNLWSMKLREKEAKILIDMDADNARLMWNKDEKSMFMLADGKIYKVDVDKAKREALKVNAEATINTDAERLAMFEHVAIRTRKGFYTPTYHGIDWEAMVSHYKQFLPHIGNGFEFAELLSELLGELNVSHSGARYYHTDPNGYQTASLGIIPDPTFTGKGIKVDEILVGGPFDRKELELAAPFIITAIDGEAITSDRDWAYYLNRKADRFILVSIVDMKTGKERRLTVKPIKLSQEASLLYRRWVKRNADEVERLSNGTLGYVHIPGMSDGPYRNIYGEMMGKYYNRKGVVVDTRFNGGGDLVSDLAMFFTGKKFIEYHNHIRQLGVEPTFRWTKPTVALVNEANYSDGSCFACGYQQLGIGKLIGMPVPGTCSFAGWETLQDGQVRWGMVPVSAKDMNGQWMENLETSPDYIIMNEPSVAPNGRDQQLETAVKVLLEHVGK